MAELKKIVSFIDKYLGTSKFRDRSYNGLQFEGKSQVTKIVVTTDFAKMTATEAANRNADMLLVHHGQFWEFQNPNIIGKNKERIKILFENDMSLYASHLPLDGHKVVGNNAQLLKLIGAKIKKEFGIYEGQAISYIGEFARAKSVYAIKAELEDRLGSEVTLYDFGKEKIKTVAVCSGSGGSFRMEAISEEVDLFLTGEKKEMYHDFADSEINLMFGGHHATETVGVKALAKKIQEKFKDVEIEYIDIPTGL